MEERIERLELRVKELEEIIKNGFHIDCGFYNNETDNVY